MNKCNALLLALASPSLLAGSFVANEPVYFYDYLGFGADLEANVCIVPGTANAALMEQPVINAIARWNELQPSSSNLRSDFLPDNKIDFESVALHELGHCIGLDHANIGAQVAGPGVNATNSTRGANGQFDIAPGADGIYGSPDDIRADDENLFYFRKNNNNPFSIDAVVDSTTYSLDVAQLPAGDLFPANPEQQVANLVRYQTPFTEAVMQHNIAVGQINRTLTHDEVATLRYAATGLDQQQGTADDYTFSLRYAGITNSDCDITIAFDPAETAAASCLVSTFTTSARPGRYLQSGEIVFNDELDWFFNTASPCNASTAMPAGEWRMISLPCDVGISSGATLAEVFGDDLDVNKHLDTWAAFEYVYDQDTAGQLSAVTKAVGLDDTLRPGVGYWLITFDTGQVIDVQGEYVSQKDIELFTDSTAGFGWNLVGPSYRFPTAFVSMKVITAAGDQLTVAEADPALPGTDGSLGNTRCTAPGVLSDDCLVARFAFKYAGDGVYETLTTTSGGIDPFDAAWIFSAAPGVAVRAVMPAAERLTP